MVNAHSVVLLWFASACGWICAGALAEVDLELQLADDWINLSDKKRREKKQQARQLLLSLGLVGLSLVSLSAWLVGPALGIFGQSLYARLTQTGKASPKASQALNVGGNKVDIAGPALRAATAMLVAMACLSVSLGHIAGPWITAEVHAHLISNAMLGELGNGDPSDIHGHVASRIAESGENVKNKHLRHLMHVHNVLRAHAENETEVRRGIGHHIKTLGHVVAASVEVAKLIGKGVHQHVAQGLENSKRVVDHVGSKLADPPKRQLAYTKKKTIASKPDSNSKLDPKLDSDPGRDTENTGGDSVSPGDESRGDEEQQESGTEEDSGSQEEETGRGEEESGSPDESESLGVGAAPASGNSGENLGGDYGENVEEISADSRPPDTPAAKSDGESGIESGESGQPIRTGGEGEQAFGVRAEARGGGSATKVAEAAEDARET